MPDWKDQVYENVDQALSWKAMFQAEPELAALRRDVLRKAREHSRGLKAQRAFCARAVMRDEIEPPLRRLVGSERKRQPIWLCQETAYARAYHHLRARLPPCRGCDCPSPAEIMEELLRPR